MALCLYYRWLNTLVDVFGALFDKLEKKQLPSEYLDILRPYTHLLRDLIELSPDADLIGADLFVAAAYRNVPTVVRYCLSELKLSPNTRGTNNAARWAQLTVTGAAAFGNAIDALTVLIDANADLNQVCIERKSFCRFRPERRHNYTLLFGWRN